MRKHIKKIGITILLTCILTLSACTNEGNLVQISDFFAEDEFSFKAIRWNSSVDEVTLLLSDKIEVDTTREPFPQGCTLYRSKSMYNLDGKGCNPTFEFQDGGLKLVRFEFQANAQESEWVEKQRRDIVKLYGTESENLERENCDLQLKTSASKWETEHTMLQFVALTDAEGETRVIIALVKK